MQALPCLEKHKISIRLQRKLSGKNIEDLLRFQVKMPLLCRSGRHPFFNNA